jgi:hypothetical protein
MAVETYRRPIATTAKKNFLHAWAYWIKACNIWKRV